MYSIVSLNISQEIIMPYRVKCRPCNYPGCPHLTSHQSGYCEQHLTGYYRQADADRGTSSERGYDSHWRRIRQAILNTEPLCRECHNQGRVTAATEVHHIDGNVNNMSVENLEPLCHECHSRITSKMQGFASKSGSNVI